MTFTSSSSSASCSSATSRSRSANRRALCLSGRLSTRLATGPLRSSSTASATFCLRPPGGHRIQPPVVRPPSDDTLHVSTLSLYICRLLTMSSQPAEDGHDGYDIFSPGFRTDPHATWSAMRASGCPVAHSGQWGGSWMPVRYDTVREIARDGERFSSRAVEVAGPLESAGGLFLPPLTSDPPQHKLHRDV